jgi:hypothetical protein
MRPKKHSSMYVKEVLEKINLLEKCILFMVNNCNTRSGGIRHSETSNNVFAKLKTLLLKRSLISVGYQAHILSKCICNAVETLEVGVENIINKVYQYVLI